MKVPYVCCSKKFEEHYTNQSGSGIPHYEGISFQRGYGLGGVFRRLFRAALPFLVRGGKVVGKEALVTGTKVINDVLSGKDLETAAKSRSKEAGDLFPVKPLLDSGSTSCFLTKEYTYTLQLKKEKINVAVTVWTFLNL
ncbi:uncharacterized protein F54H12.2 [Caerostris darwini]|uniref:Uncharacterized protein F54H12.2 n=1 Tax=Caerostris darwini TaxID=1538125 RepID=A0AAV4WQA6_9ARAC|nr:uncharacterized protein F54H12.2 [Caerostris darwini]